MYCAVPSSDRSTKTEALVQTERATACLGAQVSNAGAREQCIAFLVRDAYFVHFL